MNCKRELYGEPFWGKRSHQSGWPFDQSQEHKVQETISFQTWSRQNEAIKHEASGKPAKEIYGKEIYGNEIDGTTITSDLGDL